MKNNQKGFIKIVLIIIVVIIVFILGAIYFVKWENKHCLPLEKSFWCPFPPPIINYL
jgi:flagellar basal body-associated protein FliL